MPLISSAVSDSCSKYDLRNLAKKRWGAKPTDGVSAVSARRLTFALAMIVAIVVLMPLLVTTLPPLHDYPGHLARMDALAVLMGQVEHPVHYLLGSFLLPNLAMDVVTLGLTAFLPPILAGWVFLGLVQILLLSGTVALHRAIHGWFSPWPLVAAFFLYNWIFLFGFINYLFGVGIMLWSVALWVAMRRTNLLFRLAAGSLLSVVTLFCHLEAFGLFAVILAGLGLTEALTLWRDARRIDIRLLLMPAIPVGVGLTVFLGLSPTAGALRQPLAYAAWFGWKPLVAYRTLLWSIPWLNVVTIGFLVAAGVVTALHRRFRVARPMILSFALLCVTFLAMPYSLSGAFFADARLPIAILFVAIAMLDLVLPPLRVLISWAILATGLLVMRSVVIAQEWYGASNLIQQYESAFDLLPSGATLYAASAEPAPKLDYKSPVELARWHPPLRHLVSLASIGRDVFVPATWANRFQQPISVLPADEAAKRLQGDGPFLVPTANDLTNDLMQIRLLRTSGTPAHEFLLLLRPETMVGSLPPGLSMVARGESFALFRIE